MKQLCFQESAKINQLLTTEEDCMVFTCGHNYLISTFKTETVSKMETDLLSLTSPLPATANYLGSNFYKSCKTEMICPSCLPQMFKNAINEANNIN